jgi:ketosteroid isomerase-like protein
MGANARLVEQAYSAFGRGDIPGLLALIDDDVEWTSPKTLPQGGESHGNAEVLQFIERVGGAWVRSSSMSRASVSSTRLSTEP